jgi:hypothetical protein
VQAHGYQIRFVPRGGASVATIPAIDLNARPAGEAPGVSLTTRREMDTQMPRRVVVKHFDPDREYNLGEQYAERLNTAAIHVTALDLAIVLTAAEAAGVAEVLLYLAWLERYAVSFVLPPSYGQLEVADVISLETPEGFVSLRLTACNTLSDQRIECEARYAAAAIYTPTATGASPAVTGETTIALRGITQAVFLDIPRVHEMQSSVGLPVAMAGVSDGWPGGSLYQSADGGATWSDLADAGAPGATIGTATNALVAVDSRLLDSSSLLAVTLATGDLYSVSLLNLLNGGNTLAYGANGPLGNHRRHDVHAGGRQRLRAVQSPAWALRHRVGDGAARHRRHRRAARRRRSAVAGAEFERHFAGQVVPGDHVWQRHRHGQRPQFHVLGGQSAPTVSDRTDGEPESFEQRLDADLAASHAQRWRVAGWHGCRPRRDQRALRNRHLCQRRLRQRQTHPRHDVASAAYSSADQVTDFGSNQATIYLKIYQLSDSIGRGYPLTASLTR